MKIETLLEKVLTGRKVKFSTAIANSSGYNGNKIIKVTDFINEKKKYYIGQSLINYIRFKDWDGKTADADIQPDKSKPVIITTDKEKLYPIRIRTEVEVEKKEKIKKDNEDNWYDYV
jgi:RNA binding exosome subunit